MSVSHNERRAKLSPAKQSLLQQRLQGQQPRQPSITRRTDRHEFPLSFAQQRLWFIHQLDPSSAAYNIPYVVRLRGNLDRQAVQHAVDEVVRRHDALRTKFVLRDGIPLQQPAPDSPVKVEVSILKGRDWEEQEAEARGLAQTLAARPFDLERGPLLRLNILVLHQNEYVLVVTMHHIVSDGWSTAIMMQEFSHFYTAFVNGKPSPLPDLPIQYADFALWQREWLRGEVLEPQLAYWRKQLAGLSVLGLPADHPRPVISTYRGTGISFHVPIGIVFRLMALNQSEKTTLFMALITAFAVLLSRLSGQKDLAIGSPVANRNRKEVEGLIGFFVNTLVMREDLHGNPTFKEMLNRVRRTAFEAYQNQDVPFEKIVEELQPEREANRTPLFQVMLSLQNTSQQSIQMPCLTVEPFDVPVQTSMFDISLMLDEEPAGLNATLIYSSDLFDPDTMVRFSQHFQVVLERMSIAPETTVDGWPLLTQQEMQQELVEWNQTYAGQTEVRNLAHWFHQQALRNPEDVAVVCDRQQLTYSGLNVRANQVAHRLIRLGVAPETRVALCMERSLGMIVAILGILKAGGAYVPIDPDCPQERMSYILEDSGALVLITDAPAQSKLPQHRIRQLGLDELDGALASEDTSTPSVDIDLDNSAYVIYTSGSTGEPKGVIVSHRNVARLFTSTQHWFGFSGHDTWTLFHSYAFDFSVWEIWGALLYGGRLVIVPYWVARTPELCYELIKNQKVTVLSQTPSAFRQLIELEEAKQLHGDDLSLRLVIFGGEALDISTLQPWFARHGDSRPRLVNMYGITETTVHVTYQPLTKEMVKGNSSLIGIKIPDLRLYVLDPHMQPVPGGVRGELYVGGAGLARGYVDRPDLTAERFLPDPFADSPGERLYRSGDQARRRTNGTLEYLGRLDQQVKIRGHRIELGEIEATLEKHEAVKQAVVIVREDQPGDKRLVAYLVLAGELDVSLMRNYLQAYLPEYMVPGALVAMERMPLTANGKLDRKALPRPQWGGDEKKYIAPRNTVEEQLSRIWGQILGVEHVGIRDNFFELGGDSILSIQILARSREAGLKIELPQLFAYQTIEGLAQVISGTKVEETVQEGTEQFSLIGEEDRRKLPEDAEDAYPMSRLQVGMLFHSEYDEGTPLYHNITSLHLRAPFEENVFRLAVEAVIERHEVLRTSFHINGYSQPLQCVHRTAIIEVEIEDLRRVSTREQEEMLKDWQEKEERRGFNLNHPGLLRFHIHRRTDESIQFSITEHHVILDGWSVASLLTELFDCYFALFRGQWKKRERLAAYFRDFIAAEMDVVQSEKARQFWRQQLNGMEIATLLWEKQRSEEGAVMKTFPVPISAETSDALSRWARQLEVSLKSVLLAAHVRILSLISGQTDVITGITSNGRMESGDAEQVLGLFLNTLPFRMQLQGGRWKDLVKKTAEQELVLLPYRRYPLIEIQKLAGGATLFNVNFNFVHFHVYRELARVGGVEILEGNTFAYTNFSLHVDFSLDPVQSRLQLVLAHNSTLARKEQIEAIGAYYQNVLEAMLHHPDDRYEITSLLSEAERDQVLYRWNDTQVEYSPEKCLHELLEEQVARTPHAVAVRYAEDSLSYIELNRRANQLGHYLRTLGVGPEVLVGISLNRSLDLVIALLGVLKAGGAYVPLDASYPAERLRWILEDIQPAVLIMHAGIEGQLPPFSGKIIRLDAHWKEIGRNNEANLFCETSVQNLAYTIYTSGSTGKPKGVGITHASAVTLMHWAREVFSAEELSGVLASTSICFDLSVYEIFAPLCWGGKVIVAVNALELPHMAAREEVKLVNTVPSAMQELVRSRGVPRSVVTVNLAGEALAASLVQQVYGIQNVRRLLNLYGPSEDTTYSTFTWLKKEESAERVQVTIGKPISNTQIYVVDEFLAPVPMGVPGQLYIGGAGLARGYLNRPELTADRFVPNPFAGRTAAGQRIYKTGDLARWLPDGNLEYLGRLDHQVKIRGFRIELGEIEAALEEHDRVRQAVVIAREDKSGDKRLVAYVVPEEESGRNRGGKSRPELMTELREHLLGKLPEYMVPGAYVSLAKLPLNHNGKIDRKSLPDPEKDMRGQEYVEPRNGTEQTLCRLWQEVLRRERVGIHDNFFRIGGHSLLAVQLISRIKQAFTIEMPLAVLFTAPTVAMLAEHIAAVNQPGRSQLSPVLVNIQPHGSLPPFFCVHAVGGQVISYGELSHELGHQQPFYGLQSPPANLFSASDVTIEQMATLYIREIRAVQPLGPYQLGGWSMGGLIAWEMAQQLAMHGERIKLLALVDTIPPSSYQLEDNHADEISMLARFAMDMSRLVGKDPRPLVEKFLLSTQQDQWKMVQDALISYGVLSPETAHEEMTALLKVFTRNFLAGKNYIVSPNNQQVVFFRASETPEQVVEPWTTLAGGGVHFHSVPGDHFTILTQPTVSIIAGLLQEHILKADEQPLQPSPISVETRL